MSENLYTFAVLILYGLVAQLNRASDSGSECRGFESRRGHFPCSVAFQSYGVFLSVNSTSQMVELSFHPVSCFLFNFLFIKTAKAFAM